MKNYKKIKSNIKKWYAKQKKEVKAGAPFSASNGVRIDNPTKEQRAAELRRCVAYLLVRSGKSRGCGAITRTQ